ncbi:BTB domain-containing protein [Aphelenchoides besseyi]|nr:BTB domain-containing protein [Aphelenchoides besseyi]
MADGKKPIDLPKNIQRRNSEAGPSTQESSSNEFNSSLPANNSTKKLARLQSQNEFYETYQQSKDSSSIDLSNRVAQTLETGRYSDVIFIVGSERKSIPAHKYILSIGSEVFAAMFHNPHFQQTRQSVQEIEIPDIESQIFSIVLEYFYKDKMQLSSDNVMAILYAARKYAIQPLESACIDYLKLNLNSTNAFLILSQSRLFDLSDLARSALEFIDHESAEAFRSDAFLDIDQSILIQVISRDTLRISELSLYQSCILWATSKCTKENLLTTRESMRQVLGDALFQIRFPLMSLREFTTQVVQSPTCLLTDREMVEIFIHFGSNELLTNDASESTESRFCTRRRCQMYGRELVINRFQRVEQRWGYTGSFDRIKFSVDVPIFITALGLYGSLTANATYNVVIEITDCSITKSIARTELKFESNGTEEPFRIPFAEPVEITPGCTYIASALLKGPDSFYGSKGLRRIARQTIHAKASNAVTFLFTFAAGTNNGTSVDDGQIPCLYFCLKMQ